jgi:hypothetical protein
VSALRFHSRVPISGDAGWIELEIKLGDIGAASTRDLDFIVSVADRFFALAEICAPVRPEIPAVLRGVVGGRP